MPRNCARTLIKAVDKNARAFRFVEVCHWRLKNEGLPYDFIAGAEGVPRWNAEMQRALDDFKALLARLTPDFQTEHGYPLDAPGSADLRKCTDYVAESFGCLAMTLEMPFKDAANHPLPATGWSPERSKRLGAVFVDALWQTVSGTPA